MNSTVKFVTCTPDPEKIIAYIARVSNPKNQDNENFEGLIKYCIKNSHWSVFEHSHLTVEINTSLAIATQILRHRSFCFQQFSQRYADSTLIQESLSTPSFRRQDVKNRQNSIDNLDENLIKELKLEFDLHSENTLKLYKKMLDCGVAKECARFILPQCTQTRLYMTGNCRSWIHYIQLRSENGTQKEHMEVANQIKLIFCEYFPITSKAMSWV